MVASFVRFCADGSLRGPDNYVIARCADGLWQVAGRAHRELDCEGPVRVRITHHAGDAPVYHGPFPQVRTVNGVLHAGEYSMNVRMPGRASNGQPACHEIAFLPVALRETSTPENPTWHKLTTDKPANSAKSPARSGNSKSSSES